MKRLFSLILIAVMALSVTSCYTHRHHPHGMPPGQAKKKYGGKSAKRYAQRDTVFIAYMYGIICGGNACANRNSSLYRT